MKTASLRRFAPLASVLLAGVAALALLLFFATSSAQPEEGDAAADDAGAAPRDLTFGIVPQQSASRLAQLWGPLAAHLGEEIGIPVNFVTTKDIPTFEACLDAGAFDIAYMNPYHYVAFSERSGYRALAHQADKKLHGLIVVREDSDKAGLEDLDGANIAFPSPAAFGASVLPRAEMASRGIAFTPAYVRSHDSVYRTVALELNDAGGGVLRTFNAMPSDLRDQLRVIYRTGDYTPHAIAALPGVSDALGAAITRALVATRDDAPDLTDALGMSGFVAAGDADWDDVRALNITPEQAGLGAVDGVICPFD